MKKLFLAFLLVFLFSFSAKGEETRNSFLYVGMNYIFTFYGTFYTGFNIGYEHSINNNFSVSLDVGTFRQRPYAVTSVRWYPWANVFFAGLGPGVWVQPFMRFFIFPTIGWRISLGQGDRWFIVPNLTGHVALDRISLPYIRGNLSLGFNW